MRRITAHVLSAAGAGALALSLMTAPGASAEEQGGKVERHPAATTKAAQQKVIDYWTPERMKNATPRGQVRENARPAPGGGASAEAVQVAPQKEFGKVFFTLGGSNYVCSGTATQSTNGDVVTTAGHCLNEGPGAYATNFAFVPAYENNNRPYGTWVAETLITTNEWKNSGDFNHDVGFAVMAENASGQSLTDVVGGYPIAFNLGYGLQFDAYGYPAASPYNGQLLWKCSGVAGQDSRGTTDHRLPCSMTGGSSGGGWITGGKLNSVNSFGYRGEKDVMYGPYFGNVEQTVYTTAAAS
ncbi:hypothetical protein BCF74_12930 [Knoellia remsis]|uniref:V8-like Glu-specific endopeptidase n=1 Tax=Knoellia remsis TaxID=407159 RepID=A0A2T0U4W3_9MICO|nr:hypothetical protein [Knoellia remsis]PRY52959.1 hypothetical protein BCF74_12930 [Knoellia remsis]